MLTNEESWLRQTFVSAIVSPKTFDYYFIVLNSELLSASSMKFRTALSIIVFSWCFLETFPHEFLDVISHPKIFLIVIFHCGDDPVSQLRWINFGNHNQQNYFKIKHFSFLVSVSKIVKVLNPRWTKCSISTKSLERKSLNVLVFHMEYFIQFFIFLPNIPFASNIKINFI